MNRLTDPVTGTVDLDDGNSTTNVKLSSTVFYGGNTLQNPCPTCSAGTCQNGPRNGQPCTVQGSGHLGDVSLDCPASGSSIGVLTIDLNLSTASQTRTVTAAQPRCRGIGYAGRRCETVQGVGAVIMVGGWERAVNIYVDPDRMAAYQISVLQVREALQQSTSRRVQRPRSRARASCRARSRPVSTADSVSPTPTTKGTVWRAPSRAPAR